MQSISFFIQGKHLFTAAGMAVLLLAAGRCQATTYYVAPTGSDSNPGTSAAPFKTIQYSINTAVNGDTIIAAAGTYPESITWITKSLTLQGAGAGQSIIDPSTAAGGPGGRCMALGLLSPTARVEGFTFQNGNAFEEDGGGMYNNGSSPTVTNCTFSGNSATGGYGGGMFNVQSSSPTVINCTFSGNSAQYAGGAMENDDDSSPTVTNCAFIGNNVSQFDGGAMSNSFSNATITNCAFIGNSATVGGGIFSHSSSPTVTNCTFSGNSAINDGGAMGSTYSSTTVTNCSFSGNGAANAGGIDNDYSSSSTVTNCILWGDAGGEISNDPTSATAATYSDVQDGYSGTGNINTDPIFVRNPFTNGATDYGDLHLQPGSPCIDAGNIAVVKSPPFLTNSSGTIIDLDGNPRIEDGAVDMGAYEFQKPPIANPGSNRVVEATGPTTPVTLDGSKSSDPDGDTLSYRWTDSSNTTIATTAQVSLNLSVGTYSFTLTVTDPSGTSSSASVQVTVQDTTPPTISGVPSNFSVAALKSSGSVVTYTAPTAADRVDGTVAVTCTPASGSTFPLGVTTVTCTATDAAGNKATATFQVNVTLGFRPPVLRFKPLTVARFGARH